MNMLLRIVVLSLVCAACAQAQTPPVSVDAHPVHLALFKNGYGVVRLRADLPRPSSGQNVTVRLDLPNATLGTFLLDWPAEVRVLDTRTMQVVDRPEPASSLPELLEANPGRIVRVRVGEEWRQARIKGFSRRTDRNQPTPAGMAARPSRYGWPNAPQPSMPGASLVLLEDDAGLWALPVNQITQVQFPSKSEVVLQVNQPREVMELTYTLADTAPADFAPLVHLSHLAPGVAWAPSYVVDISAPEQARLIAKAVVLNDLLPLEQTQVDLVTGFPHLLHAGVPDAMALSPVATFLQAVRQAGEPRRRDWTHNSYVLQQRAMPAPANDNGLPPLPVMGETTEDLSFYPLSAVTLAPGERGYYQLFDAQVDYAHIYAWDIPDLITEDHRYSNRVPEAEPELVVWHALRLQNPLSMPWTTAPAMTMSAGRLLGQDTLHYTPPQGASELRITHALFLVPQATELEVERVRNAARFYGNDYDLVTVQGELALTNRSDKAVRVRLTKTFNGELKQADREPTVTKLVKGLQRVNPRSQLQWEMDVATGAQGQLKLTYLYQIYVRI